MCHAKSKKKEICSSLWSAQHPKADQNIQHAWQANVLKDGDREKIFMDGKLKLNRHASPIDPFEQILSNF